MATTRVAVAIIGTGFAGLGMAIRLKQAGRDDFVLLERADDVGGTWRDNTYPGCQCDVPSHLYSFSFAPNPDWSRTYSEQSEICEYLRRCARDFGVVPHIRFGSDVESAAWNEDACRWQIETASGTVSAQLLIAATGPLSEPSWPDIPGLDSFRGACFHTGSWDDAHDLRGERVAVIGTGASVIQTVPKIAPDVQRLSVFQRTPPWVEPHSDRPTTPLERRIYRAFPALQRLVRGGIYTAREALVIALAVNPKLTAPLQKLALKHLERQIPDPELRAKLTPGYTIGCKRILPSNRWYPALMRDNVDLVTDPIAEVRERSIVTRDGTEREVDTIILGTGFSVTDMPVSRRIRGSGGRLLSDVWADGAQAYLGTAVSGFPNMFLLIGPNTGLGHTSMVYMIESHLRYVMDAIETMDRRGIETVDVRGDVVERYNDRVQKDLSGTVWNQGGCSSWYLDRRGRNTTLWPSFTWRFRRATARFDPESYELTGRSAQHAAA